MKRLREDTTTTNPEKRNQHRKESSLSDVLHDHYEFLPSSASASQTPSWESRLVGRYCATLNREYALCDLSRADRGQIGLRWRTESEVISGKGKEKCGAIGCNERAVADMEVLFVYKEKDEKKEALVKVAVCPACQVRLAAAKKKEKEKRQEKERAGRD